MAGTVHKGTAKFHFPFYGVRSEIEEYLPFVHINTDGVRNQVTAWVMLARVDSGESRWAQLGWRRNRTGDGEYSRWKWAQWTNDSGLWYDNYWAPESLGTFTKYAISRAYDYDFDAWAYSFRVDGSPITTKWVSWVPDSAQWFGEINTLGSQMPGETSDRLGLQLVQWHGLSGTWFDADSPVSAETSNYGTAKLAADWYLIWDKAC